MLLKQRLVIFALAMVGLSACGDLVETTTHYHRCDTWTNTAWHEADLAGEIDHSDPRSCPISLDGGQLITTAATIFDLGVDYPDFNAMTLTVTGYDDYDPRYFQGFYQLYNAWGQESFVWELEGDTWQRVAFVSISFGVEGYPGTDYAEHRIDLLSHFEDAIVTVGLEYEESDGGGGEIRP